MLNIINQIKVSTKNYSFSGFSQHFLRNKHVWNSERVVSSPFEDIVVPEENLNDYVWRNLDKWATKTATVNAMQVAPAELESVIKEHPAVLDAAVIGIPDPKTGERPKAFVVLNKGVKCTAEDVMEFVSGRVAPYKKIKEVMFIDSVPKNPSGKILRRVIKDQYCT